MIFFLPIMFPQKVATGQIMWAFATYPVGLECPRSSPVTFIYTAI